MIKSKYYAVIYGLTAVAGIVPAQQSFAVSLSQKPLPVVKPEPFNNADLPKEELVNEEKPVMLSADNIEYLQNDDVVVARGKVEIVQGETILLADKLTYSRKLNKVNASGNVSVMEKLGNVIFADEVELTNNLKSGVVDSFKARMNDDALFAANKATRVNEDVLELEQAVYSPCKVKCAQVGEEGEDPLWQIRANHVRVDQAAQKVTYDDASMEIYGVPVLYTPYLSHHTPNADNQSGLMPPELGRNDNLGAIVRLPVYYSIAPDKDLTITPTFTGEEGLVLGSEYRQKFDVGQLYVENSITRPRERDGAGNVVAGSQWRGHVFAEGNMEVNDKTDVGFNIRRTSDDTYLRRYDISEDTLLTSRIYGESYDFIDGNDRNSVMVEAVGFEGLTAQDNSEVIPLILPMVSFAYETEPGAYDSRFFVDSNAMMLTRDTGVDSQRLSNIAGWKLPFISADGQVIEFTSQLRADVYHENDVALAGGNQFDGTTGRFVPEVSALWRYPFLNQMENNSVLIEPVVNLALSPNGGNPEKLSNEDSALPEFTDTNLFSNNRFAGYDRIETGARVSYGLRGLAQINNAYVDGLFGQYYRANEDRNFPLSNDVRDNLSDYVGKLGTQYDKFYLAYRFRLDKESLSARRNELDASYTGDPVSFSLAYLTLKNDPVLLTRKEVVGNALFKLNKQWTWGIGARRDLDLDQITDASTQLIYKNECISISNMLSREYTRDRDIKPGTKYLLRLTLKNLN